MSKSRIRPFCVILLAMACLTPSIVCRAQILEDVRVVTSPTASILPHGGYLFQGSMGSESAIVAALKVGFFDRCMIGASYGFQGFVGRGDMHANDRPGFEVRLRIIEESEAGPAFVLGIDTQGENAYLEDANRYTRKSKGIYAALGKNYRVIGDCSINAGVNYSFENRDEGGMNVFCGFELEIINGFSVLLDYEPALDDNNGKVATHLTRGRGYLDSGVRFGYRDNLVFKILFRDLMGNYIPESGVDRGIEFSYISSF
ncbi:MAG: hypothetical protein PHD74_07260 [Candidatus Krumholzibacteria bacterium]|nr:hypothetical protein [Candidatus Krumholzibacteria bacterium]